MQAAGNLIAAAAELAARVQDRVNNCDSRQAGLLLHADRHAAPVIPDIDDVARQNLDVDAVAVTGKRLVDRIVHNLIDEVVQAARPRGADVHARALPDSLQPLENLNLVRTVIRIYMSHFIDIHLCAHYPFLSAWLPLYIVYHIHRPFTRFPPEFENKKSAASARLSRLPPSAPQFCAKPHFSAFKRKKKPVQKQAFSFLFYVRSSGAPGSS